MADDYIDFDLPLGLVIDEKVHRHGRMRLATTADELSLQDDDASGFNIRYRDISLLARVIDRIGDVSPVTPDTIRELFEADFLYLQLLYRQLNGDVANRIVVTCPTCGIQTEVNLANVYKDMSLYEEKKD